MSGLSIFFGRSLQVQEESRLEIASCVSDESSTTEAALGVDKYRRLFPELMSLPLESSRYSYRVGINSNHSKVGRLQWSLYEPSTTSLMSMSSSSSNPCGRLFRHISWIMYNSCYSMDAWPLNEAVTNLLGTCQVPSLVVAEIAKRQSRMAV